MRAQNASERLQARDRIRKVMQHARDVDEIEIPVERGDILDPPLVEREIAQMMLVPEIGFVCEARSAQINAGDARLRMIESIARGRVAAAAGHQNVDILPRRPIRPECMLIARDIATIAFAADFGGVEVGNGVYE